jgi:hypothetical protein
VSGCSGADCLLSCGGGCFCFGELMVVVIVEAKWSRMILV